MHFTQLRARHRLKAQQPAEELETPLFGRIKPLPRARLSVGGWLAGDLCFFRDPKIPGSRISASVIAALPQFHEVVIRVEGRNGHVSLNPIMQPHLISRRAVP